MGTQEDVVVIRGRKRSRWMMKYLHTATRLSNGRMGGDRREIPVNHHPPSGSLARPSKSPHSPNLARDDVHESARMTGTDSAAPLPLVLAMVGEGFGPRSRSTAMDQGAAA